MRINDCLVCICLGWFRGRSGWVSTRLLCRECFIVLSRSVSSILLGSMMLFKTKCLLIVRFVASISYLTLSIALFLT